MNPENQFKRHHLLTAVDHFKSFIQLAEKCSDFATEKGKRHVAEVKDAQKLLEDFILEVTKDKT